MPPNNELTFRKEGTLSHEEAHEDVANIKKGADGIGVPLTEITSNKDFEALIAILEEHDLYESPRAVDTIRIEHDYAERMRKFARAKTPEEVACQEEAENNLFKSLETRFGIRPTPFPTERMLIFSPETFSSVYSSDIPLKESGTAEGKYLAGFRLIVIKDQGENDLKKLAHITAHELTHFAVTAHSRERIDSSVAAVERQLTEGVTEQIAIESIPGMTPKDEDYVSGKYYSRAYLRQRALLMYMMVEMKKEARDSLLANDPLAFFVRSFYQGDPNEFRKVLTKTFGKGTLRAFVDYPGPIEAIADLSKRRKLVTEAALV